MIRFFQGSLVRKWKGNIPILTVLVIFTKYNAAAFCALMVKRMITARQIRAGRALLGWTQQLLADRALVAVNTLRAVEKNEPYPKAESVAAIRKALVKAGIVFLSDGVMGEGVRLSKPIKKSG